MSMLIKKVNEESKLSIVLDAYYGMDSTAVISERRSILKIEIDTYDNKIVSIGMKQRNNSGFADVPLGKYEETIKRILLFFGRKIEEYSSFLEEALESVVFCAFTGQELTFLTLDTNKEPLLIIKGGSKNALFFKGHNFIKITKDIVFKFNLNNN